ncbi:unnamed protein product [Allacma fusca]|uniref:Uncharacterized protein n=1 Tax=Allacma fusca TaxID=39272 RepID=A0A8J2P7F8_9HEXA|nr:unnamed protein product [Allacma fusca]
MRDFGTNLLACLVVLGLIAVGNAMANSQPEDRGNNLAEVTADSSPLSYRENLSQDLVHPRLKRAEGCIYAVNCGYLDRKNCIMSGDNCCFWSIDKRMCLKA